MKLPIIKYGNSVLRKKCEDITKLYPNIEILINDMWETLYTTNGIGLSACQVNHPIKLFIVDSEIAYKGIKDDDKEKYFKDDTGIKEVFINAKILEYSDNTWYNEEGCLSIPSIYEEVKRPWSIKIEYLNTDFEYQIKTFEGTTARIIQHEYDHTDGKLFIEHINQLKRKLLINKLNKIIK